MAAAFGGSGAPAVPVPGSRRAALLALQYADDERGRFTERILKVPAFNALAPGGLSVAAANQQISVSIVSNRTSFVRLVAVRGVLKNSSSALTGLEEANLLLQVSINGEENLVTSGEAGGVPASFAELFATDSAPWFWFAAPPRMRIGDLLNTTVTNDLAISTETNLTPAVSYRIVDDQWWQAMYGAVIEDEGAED